MPVDDIVFEDALFNTHAHFRSGRVLQEVVPYTSRIFGYVGCQGNLKDDEVTTVERADSYLREVRQAGQRPDFRPLMWLYLTEETTKEEIDRLVLRPDIMLGVKMYQRGASGTTGSSRGIRKPSASYPIFEHMEKLGVPLLIHAEDPNKNTDPFDRAAFFIDREFPAIAKRFPELYVTEAHTSCITGVEFAESASDYWAAEVTPMHLLMNRTALWEGGLMRGQHNCLPILKRERHRQAIEDAVIGRRSKKFHYGDDSAPHEDKDAYACCAGCFAAPSGFEATVQWFVERGAVDLLPDFMGARAIAHYKLQLFKRKTIVRYHPWEVPTKIGKIVPLFAGRMINYKVVTE